MGERTEYRAALERTIEESDALIRTFNALLMIARARVGAGARQHGRFRRRRRRQRHSRALRAARGGGQHDLQLKTAPAPLHGNRELISQALANIVENAIKYGKPVVRPIDPEAVAATKEILIEARREGDAMLLSVTDHGPGIPEADRKHAVEQFVRLKASRTLPGSGLGLSLASAVATLHGGELRLGDAHPGLVATLVIPARAGAADRLAAQTQGVPQKAVYYFRAGLRGGHPARGWPDGRMFRTHPSRTRLWWQSGTAPGSKRRSGPSSYWKSRAVRRIVPVAEKSRGCPVHWLRESGRTASQR